MSKDIFDLFRKNQDKLNQKPSPKAWSRVERRIQTPLPIGKKRSIRRMRLPMGVAAALLLMIGLMVTFLWMFGKEKEQRIYAQISFEIEELSLDLEDQATNVIKITVKNQQLKPLKPINEGRIDQKLLVSTSKVSRQLPAPNSSIDSIREEQTGR